jgi:hypothetical protein
MSCFAAPKVDKSVTSEEVEACQQAWADAIVRISKIHKNGGDFVAAAGQAAGELYGYGHGTVLFKPTKAAEYPFRPSGVPGDVLLRRREQRDLRFRVVVPACREEGRHEHPQG